MGEPGEGSSVGSAMSPLAKWKDHLHRRIEDQGKGLKAQKKYLQIDDELFEDVCRGIDAREACHWLERFRLVRSHSTDETKPSLEIQTPFEEEIPPEELAKLEDWLEFVKEYQEEAAQLESKPNGEEFREKSRGWVSSRSSRCLPFDFENAQLQGADLRGIQLQGANLRCAKLQGADLRGACLQGANLTKAELQAADLRGAQLQGATLHDARLASATLVRAKLQGVWFMHADLSGSDLTGADLSGAYLAGAKWKKGEAPKCKDIKCKPVASKVCSEESKKDYDGLKAPLQYLCSSCFGYDLGDRPGEWNRLPCESGCSPASLGGSSPRNVTRRWSTSDWPEALVRTLLDATASLQSKIVEEMLRKDGSFEKEFQKIVDLGQASIEKRERELGRDKRDEERKRSKLKDEMEQMETLKKAWDDLQSFADAKTPEKQKQLIDAVGSFLLLLRHIEGLEAHPLVIELTDAHLQSATRYTPWTPGFLKALVHTAPEQMASDLRELEEILGFIDKLQGTVSVNKWDDAVDDFLCMLRLEPRLLGERSRHVFGAIWKDKKLRHCIGVGKAFQEVPPP
ncbi:unnamed protein product [Durusdinium trenchii]|uniref:Pentapeptide repeat-containing protein n=1 Tax=Durusdinium trenchii TaxID=1381693 RepID=A0ABP0NPD4_9DINO